MKIHFNLFEKLGSKKKFYYLLFEYMFFILFKSFK